MHKFEYLKSVDFNNTPFAIKRRIDKWLAEHNIQHKPHTYGTYVQTGDPSTWLFTIVVDDPGDEIIFRLTFQ